MRRARVSPFRRHASAPGGGAPPNTHCKGRGWGRIIPPNFQGATPLQDIVIRGGKIIDGTGQAAFSGDVAIDGDRIAAGGGKQGPGKREIDADGLLVTPGWV